MNKVITNMTEFIFKHIEKDEIPRAAIDVTFMRTLRKLNDSLGYQRFQSIIGYPTPTFIEDILYKCESEYDMKFIEYIIYLKVYRNQSVFNFISKKKKDTIIREINDKYHVRVNYQILQKYLNTSFRELAENLGYELEMKFARELVLKE